MKLTYDDFSYHLGAILGTLENEKAWSDFIDHGLIKPETLRELKRIVKKTSVINAMLI